MLTRAQAIESGLSEKGIQVRLEGGRWITLCPGVYSMASAMPTWERQLTAAVLSRPGSVAAGMSAAYLHRMDGFQESRPTILCPPGTNARLQIGRVVRVADFDEVGKTTVRGFLATTVAETLWTLARSLPAKALNDLVDQQVAMGRTTTSELLGILQRVDATRQRGLASFRKAVRNVDPAALTTAASLLEVALYRLLSQPGIPSVSRQHPFRLDQPARVDAYIPDWRLVVEADGRNWHTRQADFQRDRDRDNRLAARGILVLRFTYDDLSHRFDWCLRTLTETGRHRRAVNTT